MTNNVEREGAPPNTPTATPDLRLRAEQPRVMRLSRRVLIGLACLSALAIAAALGYALQNRQGANAGQELYSTENHPAADGLADLPSDYTGIPRQPPQLGPALPGDLGPPMLHTQEEQTATGNDENDKRLTQEEQAALSSGLFIQTSQQPGNSAPASTDTLANAAPGGSAAPPPVEPGTAQNMQDEKLAFVNGSATAGQSTVSTDQLESPPSPYVLQAGSVIPAALITGLESDLPGQITAQVTEKVYDSPTGKYLLIPQGARLLGQYDSSVSFGQSRVLMVWTRLIMPDGQSIVLERQEGADPQGYSGLQDGVDYHWWGIAKAAVLSTVLGIGSELGANNNDNDIVLALREGTANTFNQAGQQIVERQLNIQPTLTDRNGLPVDVVVDRDLVLAPYGQPSTP